eukprot:1364881-Amorphochlora_amoeboformis.AAC.1
MHAKFNSGVEVYAVSHSVPTAGDFKNYARVEPSGGRVAPPPVSHSPISWTKTPVRRLHAWKNYLKSSQSTNILQSSTRLFPSPETYPGWSMDLRALHCVICDHPVGPSRAPTRKWDVSP